MSTSAAPTPAGGYKVPALAHFAAGAPGGWGKLVEPLVPRPGEPVLVNLDAKYADVVDLDEAVHALRGGVTTATVVRPTMPARACARDL